MTRLATICLAAICLAAHGQPQFPPAAAPVVVETNLPDVVRVSWNLNPETNVVGYYVWTNAGRVAFVRTPSNSLTFPLPDGTNRYAVTATNSAGLESPTNTAMAVYIPRTPTNIIVVASVWGTNLTHTGGTNWTVILTNPPGTRFYRHDISGRVE